MEDIASTTMLTNDRFLLLSVESLYNNIVVLHTSYCFKVNYLVTNEESVVIIIITLNFNGLFHFLLVHPR